MSISPSDRNLALMHMQEGNDVQRKLDMDGLRKRLEAAPDKAAKLREACEGFEAVFIQKMWEEMRKNVPKSGATQSRDEHMYQGMYDAEFSKKMTEAGGIGLADMLYEQLSMRLGESSRTTTPRNNPHLPIIPAASAVSNIGITPGLLEEPARGGIPLNNRQIKPLYEDAENVPVSGNPKALSELGTADRWSDGLPDMAGLSAFDEAAFQEAGGDSGSQDTETASQRLMQGERAGVRGSEPDLASEPPMAVPMAANEAEALLSAEEEALLRAALRVNMAESGRIDANSAPLPNAARLYAPYEDHGISALRGYGTEFASELANSAESAAKNLKNNLPES